MTLLRSVIRGVGSHLPATVLTNHDLSLKVDTTDDWIVQRTGIRARHLAAEGEVTSDLGIAAARAALEAAGLSADDIDLVVVATSTPDQTFPATAVTIQSSLGITRGAAFDVQAVCTGFVYALVTADSLIKAGQASRALVVGAETFSRILDWEDRATCVLFGDGAGAVVLEADDTAAAAGQTSLNGSGRGILASRLRADGNHRDKLFVDGGPSSTGTVGVLKMQGREVFKLAVGMVIDVIYETLDAAGYTPQDIDWFVPHQANRRIIEASAKKIGIPEDRVVMTVEQHGNTSAASIPLALDLATRDGRIKQGDLVLLEAMGGGFTWGAALVRW